MNNSRLRLVSCFFVLHTLWRHLWSITVQTWNNSRTLGNFRPNYSLSDQKSSQELLIIIQLTFIFVNMMVCFRWQFAKVECYPPTSSADEKHTLLSKPMQLVHTRNWYIMENCAISLLQNVWVWVYNVRTWAQVTRWQHGSLGFLQLLNFY